MERGELAFKVLKNASILSLERELNSLEERWNKIKVHSIVYKDDELIAVVELSHQILPNTYYAPLEKMVEKRLNEIK
jgi:hypothetical protein